MIKQAVIINQVRYVSIINRFGHPIFTFSPRVPPAPPKKTVDPMNAKKPIQTVMDIQGNQVLIEVNNGSVACQPITVTAIGKPKINIVPKIAWRRLAGVIESRGVVIASVANMVAPKGPIAAIPNNNSDIRDTCCHKITFREKQLIDRQTKASLINQPNRPISYSLIMRQEGSNSGLIKCKRKRIMTKALTLLIVNIGISKSYCFNNRPGNNLKKRGLPAGEGIP